MSFHCSCAFYFEVEHQHSGKMADFNITTVYNSESKKAPTVNAVRN